MSNGIVLPRHRKLMKAAGIEAPPFKAGHPVALPAVGECVVQQCFYGVGGWRVVAKGPTSRANPKGLYDFPAALLTAQGE